MNFFPKETIYPFMGVRNIFLIISAVLILGSLVLLFTKGINFGVDFSGGSVIQVKYDQVAPLQKIRSTLKQSAEFQSAYVTNFGSDEEVLIKASIASENLNQDTGDLISQILKDTGNFEIRRVDIVGSKVGAELREQGILSVVLSLIVLLIYVSYRFEWRFALASIGALVHDLSITIGVIILLGVDFNLDILAALLMILGYSLNDTIVVFDRVREELQESKQSDLATIINEAVSRTLSRTTLTSLTTLFVVLTLYLFGGEILAGFSLTMLVGIIVGTYSSIFVASTILIVVKFSVPLYKKKELEKEKIKKEKERLRSMYEKGVV